MKNRKDVIQKLKNKMDDLTGQQEDMLSFENPLKNMEKDTLDKSTKKLHKNKLEEASPGDVKNVEE